MLEAARALSSTTVFSGRAIRKLINFNETTDRRFYSLAALHFFARARAFPFSESGSYPILSRGNPMGDGTVSPRIHVSRATAAVTDPVYRVPRAGLTSSRNSWNSWTGSERKNRARARAQRRAV